MKKKTYICKVYFWYGIGDYSVRDYKVKAEDENDAKSEAMFIATDRLIEYGYEDVVDMVTVEVVTEEK